ncbi:hypothetical protein [Acinetobacter nectaris]|uniref:phage tail fiber protein n=1 Tax=Acinetobacter nectaris TaxID=1219382 RepID=UPI001F3B26A4|nr:hypothetical protein [Acinetobacter nectaris]MCF9035192.1 hypothetical protein [Acinetobacter nectaris]
MTKQTVNIGNNANDGSGDPARTAFTKINQTMSEIYSTLGDGNNLYGIGTATNQLMQVGAFGIGSGDEQFGVIPISGFNSDASNKYVLLMKNESGAKDARLIRGTVYLERGESYAVNQVVAVDVYMSRAYLDIQYTFGSVCSNVGDLNLVTVTYNGQSYYALKFYSNAFGRRFFVGTRHNPSNDIFIVAPSDISNEAVITKIGPVRTGTNTTVDGNGYLKPSSPVVRLYANSIELINEANGKGITFEKLGVGNYLVKNTTGLRDDGWYIETPRDNNGNVLVFVEYTQLDNKDISVKTYKKKFDIDTASIVADHDNPMDIPTDRWVDLRFNDYPVPEQQPTPEATS